MRCLALLIIIPVLPARLVAQSATTPTAPDSVMFQFARIADIFGSQLIAAFDSIPAARYGYRPTPAQQTVGYIAQHLEAANYSLCGRFGELKRPGADAKPIADTVRARWPKDTLVARLRASLRFCDSAIDGAGSVRSPALASNLLLFETDLAEHYSQISTYMRLIGLVPPSALPRVRRTAFALPASELPSYVGVYRIIPGVDLHVTAEGDALFVRSTTGSDAVRLWPESRSDFFVNEVDAQVTFVRDAGGGMTGLVLHQYGRDRPARKIQ
jgi:hypothetical protein